MAAEQNEGGNVPAHDENADGHANKQRGQYTYITQVFGGQVQGVGAECFHKSTIHRTEQNEPEDQQHLKFFKVQHEQLNRK